MRAIFALVLLVGCGGPALQNIPHPNNTAMAAGFAAVAGAATLASPADAQKKAESQTKTGPNNKPVKVNESVPESALDNLDHQAPDDGTPKAQPLPPMQDPTPQP